MALTRFARSVNITCSTRIKGLSVRLAHWARAGKGPQKVRGTLSGAPLAPYELVFPFHLIDGPHKAVAPKEISAP